VLMADALNLTPKMSGERREAIAALLQSDGDHQQNYEGHSGGIIDTVEELAHDFIEEKGDMKHDEQNAQQEHDKLVLSKELQIGTAQKNLEGAEETRATTTKEIASTQQDLTKTLAQLHDDQAYLRDLTAKCEDKSKEWDQRSKMRQDELSALTEALAIIKGTVTAKTTEKTVRLVEQKAVVKPHVAVADQDSDDEEDEDVSFLQVESPRAKLSALAMDMKKTSGFLEAKTPRDRLMALLTSKGKQLKSTVLASLATKVAADPFLKIKKLVQELIERLLQEAADEANHKGWCDKELTNAKQQRTYKSDAIKKLNSQLETAEARRDKLTEDIATLTTEIAELSDSLSSTTAQRAAESAENAATVSEAEEGQAAVEQAFDVLDHFYKTAAKAEVLVQVRAATSGVDDDLPDTGFGGANKGSQGAATGILGMLEVIKSDFVRTIKETEKAEKEAETEFIEFERTTKVSITSKTSTKTNNEAEKADTVTEISEAMSDLREEQELLDKALQELEELRPACIDTGMSYEERVARREQEIEALNEALCILDAEGPVQTEPSC